MIDIEQILEGLSSRIRCFNPNLFEELFPFYFALDHRNVLVAAGRTFRSKFLPYIDAPVGEAFQMIHPREEITFAVLQNLGDQHILLQHKRTLCKFRGQWMFCRHSGLVFFIGSPWFSDTKELDRFDLTFCDFAIHDATIDMLQLYQAAKSNAADLVRLTEKLNLRNKQLTEQQSRLNESEAYFRSLADSGLALIRTSDLDGQHHYFNKPWLDFTGRTLGQETGDGWTEGIHPEDLIPYLQAAGDAFGKRETFNLVFRLRSHDGVFRHIENHGTPRYDSKGRFVGYIIHGFDVTDRMIAELQSRRSQRLDSIGQLAGGIAHDLNNTLSPIILGLDVLESTTPGEAEMLDTMRQSAQRAAEMVRQLLSFAKGASGQRLTINVDRMIREIQGIVKSTFPKNISLEVCCGNDLPTVIGDATQIHQVLLNLCVNARDAMPHGGQLSVYAEQREVDELFAVSAPKAKPGHYLVLTVEDTGVGMTSDVVDRIFDPFFTTKAHDQGTGLGLSTVLGIVKGHGGFLRVESQTGVGSKFSVYLPSTPSSDEIGVSYSSGCTFRGEGQTLLIVDDEKPVREIQGVVLQRLNFNSVVATDGADGLLKVVSHRETLSGILVDMHMPFMDGIDFIRAVRRMLPKIPILAMSGRFDEATKVALIPLNVRVMLTKPFSEEQLAVAMERMLS